ncbi:hypothetical protein [Kitasatospora kifunensis]|uniref:Ferric oxidoreductase domain-containing protein n=1 Tax=Kitasatospora kifunensis TaxID=58351 RepID=A0A7W7VZN9_KITKI|nr:hypothetical protein [Kitasatospora kifunensis]MBB4927914.1 hypothetical protein [Kitasatospora kifunensis]
MSGSALFAGVALGGAPISVAGRVMAFLDYFAGVFTLLALTAAVVCGLAATDRLVLTPRLRVAVQSVHRATAVAALGFLAVHIAVKVAEHHAGPQEAVLPFTAGSAVAVGLGTVAADLLVLVAATGALRGRFAGSRHAWLWRVLHAGAYACWPIALAHGLTAGRAAHAWVLWGYGLCAALVALALLVRALSWLGRHRTTTRHRRRSKAHRPSSPRPASLTGLRTPPTAGDRPAAWVGPHSAGAGAAAATAPRGRTPQQPRHAARPAPGPGPGPLGLAQPGGGR